jgi:hypothetical protein
VVSRTETAEEMLAALEAIVGQLYLTVLVTTRRNLGNRLDRLRTLIPRWRAENPEHGKVALDILRLAKLANIAPHEAIVRRAVIQERQQERGRLDDLAECDKRLPGYKEHMAQM